MNYSNLYILLSVIKNNGDIRRLKREGMEYIEIAELTNQIISGKLAVYTEETIILTAEGESKLIELEKTIKRTKKINWIEKEMKSKISQLDKNFIFLPNQNELEF
jgi:hypothetical protein